MHMTSPAALQSASLAPCSVRCASPRSAPRLLSPPSPAARRRARETYAAEVSVAHERARRVSTTKPLDRLRRRLTSHGSRRVRLCTTLAPRGSRGTCDVELRSSPPRSQERIAWQAEPQSMRGHCNAAKPLPPFRLASAKRKPESHDRKLLPPGGSRRHEKRRGRGCAGGRVVVIGMGMPSCARRRVRL